MLNILQPVREISEEKKALIPRTEPETAAPTHSIIFLSGRKQKILFLMYRRLQLQKGISH